MIYDVNEIFHSLQGEGEKSGSPATFIRLAGCNLKCSFCDTQHQVAMKMTAAEIVDHVNSVSPASYTSMVVITGGEPFLQDLHSLLFELTRFTWKNKRRIEIETNGTMIDYSILNYPNVFITCSPKEHQPVPVKDHLLVNQWKYIISIDTELLDGLPKFCFQPMHSRYINKIYVQPMDEKDEKQNQLNVNHCIKLCLSYGYHLSLQVQKITGLR